MSTGTMPRQISLSGERCRTCSCSFTSARPWVKSNTWETNPFWRSGTAPSRSADRRSKDRGRPGLGTAIPVATREWFENRHSLVAPTRLSKVMKECRRTTIGDACDPSTTRYFPHSIWSPSPRWTARPLDHDGCWRPSDRAPVCRSLSHRPPCRPGDPHGHQLRGDVGHPDLHRPDGVEQRGALG